MALLERAIQAVERRMVLLAPPGAPVPDYFDCVDFDLGRHTHLLQSLQQFRGAVYLQDGAVTREQLPNGLHETPEDDRSWHLVMLDGRRQVVGCAWYLDHDNRVHFDRLRLRHSPLAHSPAWRVPLWTAVNEEIARARKEGVRYAEVGGWAVASECRHTPDGLIVALAAYCLGRIRGETLGITTATARHGSANILGRIGGRPLSANGITVPPYYDPRYRCVMEILRFDSRYPEARFKPTIDLLLESIAKVPVVARPYWPLTQRAPSHLSKTPTWQIASVGQPTIDYGSVVATQLT